MNLLQRYQKLKDLGLASDNFAEIASMLPEKVILSAAGKIYAKRANAAQKKKYGIKRYRQMRSEAVKQRRKKLSTPPIDPLRTA